ncbi:xanthine dehydrogenase family protein molybdopterin-binding subunit [Rhizobium leguminosarum]|uniref:xanthine dehydrogenase family protein molybdopterin-binding subunit n=1 Tax=Rhizobium leguminosarum TaxID=384 RepID=UPI001C95CAAF|nr:xanthine dehydrogenase family protein molybdopterin-binding subunit [Rhizobium leguminosarum]MBY5768328.1 xanthine dehydrogenase family protein molybdopterin-binding subunit [Rhizobium leguminosarum]
MTTTPFKDRARIDAVDKVRGATAYAADIPVPGMLYAMLVPSLVAKGRIATLHVEDAVSVPGVVRILTPDDFPPPPEPVRFPNADAPPTLHRDIAFRGQPIALVVAETLEAATEGAERVAATFETQPFAATKRSALAAREEARPTAFGDAEAALAQATMTVDVEYESPAQHHNPIELISTTAVWTDGRLTIYEGTQFASGIKEVVARILRIDPGIVDVKSPSVGGAFGQKGWVQQQTAIIARAAMLLGRPVKLVTPRGQIFHLAKFRPNSTHRIRLGADAAGKMTGVHYVADQQQSRRGTFPPDYHAGPTRLYGIRNYYGGGLDYRIDTQPPGHMRAPHEHPACFAFECAVDELAYSLGADPVDFRIANDTRVDPQNGRPLSSRHLNECLSRGAQRFGWSKRTPKPGSMRAADGSLVGWGVASGIYPALVTATVATLRISADGTTRFATTHHEFGQGIKTAIGAVLLDGLEIDAAKLDIVLGDTTVAPQQITAGSWGTFSVVPTAALAVERMRAAISELLAGRQVSGTIHQQLAAIRRPFLTVEVSLLGPGQDAAALERLRRGQYAIAGPTFPEFTAMSYIAHFVEVQVEPTTRRIRMPRVVSVADCGRVVSPRTAVSQVRGGVVWAFGAALREATEVDPRFGGFLNNDLVDYVVPVNADIGEIEVDFINEPDPVANSVGVKGLGEVAMVGASAAIVNAIFHATGKRLRKLPVRIEHLLQVPIP